jgi:hypothetical protein
MIFTLSSLSDGERAERTTEHTGLMVKLFRRSVALAPRLCYAIHDAKAAQTLQGCFVRLVATLLPYRQPTCSLLFDVYSKLH